MTAISFIHCSACEILTSNYSEGGLFLCPNCNSDKYTKFIGLGIDSSNMYMFYSFLDIRDIDGNRIAYAKDTIDLKKLKPEELLQINVVSY